MKIYTSFACSFNESLGVHSPWLLTGSHSGECPQQSAPYDMQAQREIEFHIDGLKRYFLSVFLRPFHKNALRRCALDGLDGDLLDLRH